MKHKLFVSFLFICSFAHCQVQVGSIINGENTLLGIGEGVAINGNGSRILISGAFFDGDTRTSRFQAFDFDGSNWFSVGQEIIKENSGRLGNIALSDSGNRMAIGLTGANEIVNGGGKVIIFEYDGFDWVQIGQEILGSREFGSLGSAISFNGNGNLVAIGESGAQSNTGAVKVYEFDGDMWLQIGDEVVGENSQDRLGRSLDLSSDGMSFVVGAVFNDGNGMSSGHLRVYRYNGLDWNQIGEDIDGEESGTQMGTSVAISADGNRIAGGGRFNDNESGGFAGHVRVYDFEGANWNQVGEDINGESEGDRAGTSIDMNDLGDRIIIGSPINSGSGGLNFIGHARVFDFDGVNWFQIGSNINGVIENDRLGTAVAISSDGNRFIVGAPQTNASEIGEVKVFDLTNTPPSAQCLNITLELNGDGVVGITVDDIDGGSFDLESDVILSINTNSFSCDSLGDNEVILTVVDDFGLSDSCSAIVTVVDVTGPIIDCLDDFVVEVDMTGFYELEDYSNLISDNCSLLNDGTLSFTQTPVLGSILEAGTTTLIELSSIDSSGNDSFCSFNITVEETLGLNDNSFLVNSVEIYPNPFETITTIISQTDSIYSFEVLDYLGRVVERNDLEEMKTSFSLDLQGKSPGIYFVRLNFDGYSVVRKLILK